MPARLPAKASSANACALPDPDTLGHLRRLTAARWGVLAGMGLLALIAVQALAIPLPLWPLAGVLAIGLGEHAELPADTRPLYTQDYLREKGLTGSRIRSVAGMFGKRVKAAYTEDHGAPPAKYPLQLPNGQVRDVLAYTEQDRPLLDAVFNRYYSEVSA